MVHHGAAKGLSGKAARVQRLRGGAQAAGHRRQVPGGVHVAFEEGRRLDPLPDAIEPRGERRRKGQVGIAVRPGNAALNPQAGAAPHHPKAGRAVVIAPGEAGRGPGTIHIALVAVHGRGVEGHQLGHAGDPPAQKPPEGVRSLHGAYGLVSRKSIFGPAPEAEVDMATGAGLVLAVLGHESNRLPHLIGYGLEALLEELVPVGHVEGLGIADVELVLAQAPLAFGVLNRDARGAQVAAGRAGKVLVAAALEQLVVLQVPARWLQAVVMRRVGVAVAILEEVILQFGGGHGPVAKVLGGGELLPQQAARGLGQQGVGFLIIDIAHHPGGAVQPRGDPQGREVWHEVKIAIAQFPIGKAIARHRLHLHVRGEEVVTGMGAPVQRRFEEKIGVEVLAREAAVVIGKGQHDRVDGAGLDSRLQAFGSEETGHGWGGHL